jgi:uncharacterized membrane protein
MEESLKTLLLAAVPVIELRGALPVALVAYKMNIFWAFLLAVVGNIMPVIFIVFLLEPVSDFLIKHSRFFRWFFKKLFHHTRTKHSHRFEQLEEVALVTFVALPLPMTGAWSGALAAFVFGIPPRKSIPLIALGVLIAGVIVTALTLGIGFFL